MTDIASLIARVEAPEGPDRELDVAIAGMAFPDLIYSGGKYWLNGTHVRIEDYTASIDAAMTLAGDPALNQYGGAVGLLRWAIDMMERAGQPVAALPRWIVAAALRAMEQAK